MTTEKSKNEPYCPGVRNISLPSAFIFFLFMFLSASQNLFAQNDLCTDAIAIACGQTLSGSTDLATADGVGTCGTPNTAPGVWYSLAGTGDDVTASLCTGTAYDSKISVFEGSCAGLVCIDGNDDFCGVQSEIGFSTTAGSSYFILVHGFGTNTGTFDLTITCTPVAPPPANDDCANAVAIACGQTLSGTTVGGTSDDVITGGFCGTTVNSPGVWYSITGNGDDITASLCSNTTFDTKISVFEGSCGTLVCTAGNDDFCGLQSQITFSSLAGTSYFILVHAFGGETGTFDLALTCVTVGIPANDDCSNAVAISCGQTLSGTTIGATADPVGLCGTAASAPGVWYIFTGTGEDIIVNTCNNPNYDTKISVFEGSCAALVCVDGNDDDCGVQSSVSFTSVAGTSYFIYVHGFGTNEGNFDLSLTCVPACAFSTVQITITTDNFGEETSFDLVNLTSNTSVGSVAEGSLADNTTTNYFFCLDQADCYSFTINDFFGDGICCSFGTGSYTVTLDGITIASGGAFGFSESTSFGTCTTPNDNCANATIITDGTGQAFSNFGATTDGTPDGLCLSFGNDQIFSDIWYSYTASCNGVATFTTVGGTSYDTRVAVYTSPCPGAILACNDDDAGTLQSTAFWSVTAGTTYLIRLGGFDAVAQGNGTFNLSCLAPVQPNDFCADAIAVSCGSAVTGSTAGAVAEGTDCGVAITAGGVWYTVTGTGDVITATTCNAGNLYDTKLSVYEGSCTSLVCVNGNDDDASCAVDPFFSTVSWLGTTGTDYFILVHGFGTNEGTFELSLSCSTPLANDDCSGVTPVTLTNGTPATFTGTTLGGTGSADELNVLGAAAVWEAITLTGACNNLTLDFCGTGVGIMETAFIVVTDCPVTGFTPGSFEFATCGDGNITYRFFNVPAGTYYLPVLSDASFNTPGSYTMTVLSEDCPPAPANDDCASVTPVTLTNGTPVTFTGTTVGGTPSADESAILGATAVWEAITLTGTCNNLTVDFCGTGAGIMETAFIVVTDCPVTGFTVGNFEFTSCGDGNITYTFFNVPAGTYYLPVLADPGFNLLGDYTMTVLSVDCPPAPANDDCASVTPVTLTNGTPVTFTGTTAGATASADEAAILGAGAVWEAVTLTGDCNFLTVDYCGTAAGIMETGFIVFSDCPVTGFTVGSFEFTSCGDGNITILFTDLPAGTYYLPVLADPGFNTLGDYTMNVLSEDCPQPPANDNVCSAQALTVGVPFDFYNFSATAEFGEVFPGAGTSPNGTCLSQDGWCNIGGAGEPGVTNSVWFTFVAPASGSVVIEAGPFDGQLAVYEVGNCLNFPTFTLLAANDDRGFFDLAPSVNSLSCFGGNTLTPGQTYYVQFDGFGGTTGNATIVVNELVCPANDDVCSAQALTLGVATAFDNSFASAQAGEITPGVGTDAGNGTCNAIDGWCSFDVAVQNSLWYTFVAPASGHVSVVAGDFDLQLAVYSAGNCADFATFTELGANDDGNPSGTFSPAVELSCLTPGQTYHVQLDGFSGAPGAGGILVSDAGPGDVFASFDLWNANADILIGTVNDGDTLNLFTLPGINIAVVPCISVGSVVFQLNGATHRIESSAPYALAGDHPTGNYQTWYTSPGNYQLIVTPYAAAYGGGAVVGTPDTVNFTVINTRVDCAGTPNGTAVQDVNGDCCQPGDLDCAGVCFGGATQVVPYLRVVNSAQSWRKLKLGNNPNSLWTPAVDVTAGGTNNMMCVTLRDALGNVDWSKILIRALGAGVVVGNYGTPGASFTQVCIPLSAFGAVNFSALTVIEIPYSNGHGAFEIHVQKVEFTGGATPYLWFGYPKTNNAHDGQSGSPSALFAELVAPPCGTPKWTPAATTVVTTEVETMMDVYPNPFNDKVTFEFMLLEDSQVTLQLYNVTGEKIATIFEGTVTGEQLYKYELNTATLASGFYLYKLQTNSETRTEKILLAR